MEPVTDHTVVPKSELFHYYVDVSDGSAPSKHVKAYDGNDAAEAMAAWSRGISDGHEYVTLEALRDRRPESTGKAPL